MKQWKKGYASLIEIFSFQCPACQVVPPPYVEVSPGALDLTLPHQLSLRPAHLDYLNKKAAEEAFSHASISYRGQKWLVKPTFNQENSSIRRWEWNSFWSHWLTNFEQSILFRNGLLIVQSNVELTKPAFLLLRSKFLSSTEVSFPKRFHSFWSWFRHSCIRNSLWVPVWS